MARIRTIKPEFWSSPDTARATAVARLAYIGMWNWADDYGRGTVNVKELEGFIFPNDDLPTLSGGTSENFRHVLAEVAECFGVTFYAVRGRDYYVIPSWNDHQRTERSAKAKHPGPDEADGPATCINTESAENVGSSAATRRKVRGSPALEVGTGEQGNREQGTGNRDPRSRPGDSPEFARFWDAYPRKTNKGDARTAWAKAIKRATPAVIQDAVVAYANDPNLPADQTKIPHASTWLNGDRWEDGPQPAPHAGHGRPTATDRMRSAWELSQQLEAEEQHRLEIGS